MSKKPITVLVVEPMKKPYIKEIETDVNALQKEVNGFFEYTYPFDELVAVICNEEGMYNGMLPNRALYDSEGNIYEIIYGKFIIAGLNDDMDTNISLSEDLISLFSKKFEKPEIFDFSNNEIKVIPIESSN